MMVVVAGLAIPFWSVLVVMRWDEYRRQAAFHARSHQRLAFMLEDIRALMRDQIRLVRSHEIIAVQPGLENDAAKIETALAREAELERKYRRAMWRPWLSVPPDPDPRP